MGSLTTLSVYLGLTTIINAAVSSGLYEQALRMTSTEICNNYTVLNDNWREIGGDRGENCDSHIKEGWHRLMTTDGHSASLPTACIKNHVCGLVVALWLDLQGEDMPQPGQTVRGFVCGAYPVLSVWQCCVVKETAFIHNCGHYFLYWLRPTDRCSVGYCGEGPRSDISPFTVKTGEPAADLGDRFRRRLRPQRNGTPGSNINSDPDSRSIRDVSTPDDLPCPEGLIRCPDRTCIASHHLCSSAEATSVSTPTTEYVTRTPITFYFSVLRERTRSPLSLTSGPSALTNIEGYTMGRPNSASLTKEDGPKSLFLTGETTPSVSTQGLNIKSTNQDDLSTFSSDALRKGSSSSGDLSAERGGTLSTFMTGSPSRDHSSTPSYSDIQESGVTAYYYTHLPSITGSSTEQAKESVATFATTNMPDATFLTPSVTYMIDSTAETSSHIRLDQASELPSKTIDERERHHASLPTRSCSACLQSSVKTSLLMSEIPTASLSSTTSLGLPTQGSISTHTIIKQSPTLTIDFIMSSSTAIAQSTPVSLRLHPTTSTSAPPSSPATVPHLHYYASLQASSQPTSQLASASTLTRASSSSASYRVPSSTASKRISSSSTLQQIPVSSVSSHAAHPDISTSATPTVIPSKMTIVSASPTYSVTNHRCTQCIQVVFNLRVTIASKQAERDFHKSVRRAFASFLSRFYEQRFYRDVRNVTQNRNMTHFLPTDIYIRNSTSSGNTTVLLLEAKTPSGDFVPDEYLSFLLQKNEVRRFLEQDLIAYGATLAEFSVPDSPTEIPVPEDESGVRSVFSQHFGLFLTVIILSSFVAFVGVIAIFYLRNKARTGMWYCPSGTRYAKQLERTLLNKTTNWRVGQVSSPIPDVDIMRGEGLMTETTPEEDDSRRASYTGERASRDDNCSDSDTWVVPLREDMDDRLSNKEYDTRL